MKPISKKQRKRINVSSVAKSISTLRGKARNIFVKSVSRVKRLERNSVPLENPLGKYGENSGKSGRSQSPLLRHRNKSRYIVNVYVRYEENMVCIVQTYL